MSDADPATITVSADGFNVRKSVDTERFQTLAVVLELASEHTDDARIQLVDEIPSEISMEDVGFHPDYGSEFWSVEEGLVAFERDFEPGEAYTTVYGLRGYDEDDADSLLVEPSISLIDAATTDLDDVVDEGRSEAVREFLSGEADLPGLGEEVADAATAASEAADAADAVAEAAENAEAEPAAEPEPPTDEPTPAEVDTSVESEVSAEPEAAHPEPTEAEVSEDAELTGESEPEPAEAAAGDSREVRVPLTGGVVRVLIKELRDGDVDPEDRRMLRDELLGTEGTTDVRITHLQQRVSDLEAYADALEAFIDQEGTAEEIIGELQDSVSEVERELRSVDDRLDEVMADISRVEARTDELDDEVTTVASQADVLTDRVEDVEAEVTHVDERTDDLGARLDRLSTDLDGIDERVSSVDGRIDDLSDDLGTVRRDLEADIESLERDLEDFGEFRERLSTVFGGAQDAGDDETVEE